MEHSPSDTMAPVLALTILDSGTLGHEGAISVETKMLLAIRDPTTNRTHPNVISVPTQRIPRVLCESLQSLCHERREVDESTLIITGPSSSSGTADGHDPLIFAVSALLTRKLGVSDDLERGRIRYRAYIRGIVSGTVRHPGISEDTMMLNVVVIINEGASHFPAESASYSHLIWTPVRSFLQTAAQKDPTSLEKDLSPVEYCIHGMCVMSSYNVLADYVGESFYPYTIYTRPPLVAQEG